MRLYTFEVGGRSRIGVKDGNKVVDLSKAHGALVEKQREPGKSGFVMPESMLEFLREGETAMHAARQVVELIGRCSREERNRYSYAFEEVRILAPIPRPGKILCSGINYRGHLDEEPGAKLPEEPFFFSKLPSVVIGPGEPIVRPKLTKQLDYEVELAVVFGKTARNVPEDRIMECVAGYTILHDVSARDVQLKDHQITLGKNFDTFAPMGPCIVTPDEFPDPSNVRLRTWVNGELMQDSTTQDWIFPLPTLLAALARVMTIEPGDVVSTGCPAGVGLFRNPQVFLKPGDIVKLEIEGIGQLINPIVEEL